VYVLADIITLDTLIANASPAFNFFVQFTCYCSGLCIVTLSAGAYCLSLQRRSGESVDGLVVAVIALSGFFGFFTSAMTLTSARYIFTNITNIDMLKGSQKYQLAIRIPRNSPPTEKYHTIVYPLARPQSHVAAPTVSSPHDSMSSSSVRDKDAIHTFAIVQTDLGENPWDLGYWRNWKSVMGNNIVEWLLPIKHSPCCNHESMESDYEYGPLIAELKRRFNLPGEQQPSAENGIEMQHRGSIHR
jgi:palmitoyltransferase